MFTTEEMRSSLPITMFFARLPIRVLFANGQLRDELKTAIPPLRHSKRD